MVNAARLRAALPIARSGLQLARAMATGRPHPFAITFIVTNRCNFRCAYCDIPERAGPELSREDFLHAIDELCDAGMARASFSGGEALLRRDTVDLIRHAHDRGAMTSLNSNAWALDGKLDALAGCLDMLMVSVDGPEATHDLVRKQKGSFQRCLRAIDRARDLGIVVTTITVLNSENLGVVDDVLELADRHGFHAYFQPAYSECFSHEAGLDPVLSSRVLGDLAERLARYRRAGRRVGASPGYLERLSRGPNFGDCARCTAGSYFATLLPDGTFVPCHLTSQVTSYPNGKEMGYLRAFQAIPRPTSGPGCAISPYQEQDLIFGLDRRALGAALVRMAGV